MKSHIRSKLPETKESIFSVMSAVAKETGAINLSQGYPDYPVDERLIQLVMGAMSDGANQYAPMAGVAQLRDRIAKKIQLFHGVSVDADTEITITTGATQALYTAISAVIHSGDEVIIIEPAYDAYAPAVVVNGGIPCYVRMSSDYQVDWDAVKNAITDRTRLIIINTPHNPTGLTFAEEDWAALEDVVANTDCLILSDEVYEHMVFDGRRPDTILKRPRLRHRAMACYSFGKLCHVTGWKMGYIVAPPSLMAEFRKVHQFVVFSCHHPTQVAIAAYLADISHYETMPAFFEHKRDLLCRLLEDSAFHVIPAQGTYFQLLTYPDQTVNQSDLDLCKWMAAEHGVAAIPLSGFYHDGYDGGALRLCFAKTERTLRLGAERLCGVTIS